MQPRARARRQEWNEDEPKRRPFSGSPPTQAEGIATKKLSLNVGRPEFTQRELECCGENGLCDLVGPQGT